jgi:hypothetical protein
MKEEWEGNIERAENRGRTYYVIRDRYQIEHLFNIEAIFAFRVGKKAKIIIEDRPSLTEES